jgi:hypothetical protein
LGKTQNACAPGSGTAFVISVNGRVVTEASLWKVVEKQAGEPRGWRGGWSQGFLARTERNERERERREGGRETVPQAASAQSS